MVGVPRTHPLFRLLAELTYRNFTANLGWPDTEVIGYLTEVLADFVHVDRLYRIRDARGRRVEEVAEMLAEGDLMHRADSLERERTVHKHIGDYTLFLSGLFPEYVASLPRRGLRLDAFVDYIKAGKESYRVVSCFDQFEFRDEAPLFRRLAESFELCVFGLNLVKRDLERFQQESYRGWRAALDDAARG